MKAVSSVSVKYLVRTAFLILLAGFIFLSCGQDPIFYQISNEPEAKDPLIAGNPTNIVVSGTSLFAAARQGKKVYCYTGDRWQHHSTPGGAIGELASDGTDLYALIFPNREPLKASKIMKYGASGWQDVPKDSSAEAYSIQTIYGAEGEVFAGASIGGAYSILHIDAGTLIEIKTGTSMLKGVAYDGTADHYLATMGSGIYKFTSGAINAAPETGTEGANMVGILNTGGNIVAVSSDGSVYSRSAGTFTAIQSAGPNFTGAMSIWNQYDSVGDSWAPALLLLGIRGSGSSLTHGYREMTLTAGIPEVGIRSPGDSSPTSIANKSKYTASLGKHPVEAIIQVPQIIPIYPADMTTNPSWMPPIFASTAKNGLWSYRNGVWNAEE